MKKQIKVDRLDFQVVTFLKFVNNNLLENNLIYFLRKTKSFIKGRYSKNRAYYRTGVY